MPIDDASTVEGGDEGVEGPDDDIGDLSDPEALASRAAYAEAEPHAEAEADPDLDDHSLEARKLTGDAIYNWAKKQLGVKYVWNGGDCNGPTRGGFDCSGLSLYSVCKASGKKIKLPHKAQSQYKDRRGKHIKCTNKKCSNAKRGDLVFWVCEAFSLHQTDFITNNIPGKEWQLQVWYQARRHLRVKGKNH